MGTVESTLDASELAAETRANSLVSPASRDLPYAVFGSPFLAGWPIVGPLAGLLLISLLFHVFPIDLAVSRYFYHAGTHSWPWFHSALCLTFYRGGIYPAVALAVTGGVLLVRGLWLRNNLDQVRAGIFLLTVFGLGPGLIVNYGFKQYWGRPRPNQVREFGGQAEFVAVGYMGSLTKANSSFPSGHAAVAYYLIAPAFLIHSRRRKLARRLLWGGLLFGAGMSATRVVQGGHFVSDVIWSAGIVYFVCVIAAHGILKPRMRSRIFRNCSTAET